MEETVTSEPMPRGTAELKAAIQRMFEQLDAADARIRRHRMEIDRLAAQTRARLDHLLRFERRLPPVSQEERREDD